MPVSKTSSIQITLKDGKGKKALTWFSAEGSAAQTRGPE